MPLSLARNARSARTTAARRSPACIALLLACGLPAALCSVADAAVKVERSGQGNWRLIQDAMGYDLSKFQPVRWVAVAQNFNSTDCWRTSPTYRPTTGWELAVGADRTKPGTLSTADILYSRGQPGSPFTARYDAATRTITLTVQGLGGPRSVSRAVAPGFNTVMVQTFYQGSSGAQLNNCTLRVDGQPADNVGSYSDESYGMITADDGFNLETQSWTLTGTLINTVDCASPIPTAEEVAVEVAGVFVPRGDLTVQALSDDTGQPPRNAGGGPAMPRIRLNSGETMNADANGVAVFRNVVVGPRVITATAENYAEGVAAGVIPMGPAFANVVMVPRAAGIFSVTGKYMKEPGPNAAASTFYIKGVDLAEQYVVNVDWGVRVPGSVTLRNSRGGLNVLPTTVSADKTKWTFDINFGTGDGVAFMPQDGLVATPIDAFMNNGTPYTLPMRVVSKPEPFNSLGVVLIANTLGTEVLYQTRANIKVPDEFNLLKPGEARKAPTPTDPPFFSGGSGFGWAPELEIKPEIKLDGTGEMGSLNAVRKPEQGGRGTVGSRTRNKFALLGSEFEGKIGLKGRYFYQLPIADWDYGASLTGAIEFKIGLPPRPVPFVVLGVPMYAQGKASAKLEASLTVRDIRLNALPTFVEAEVQPEIGIGGLLGVGADGIGGIEAEAIGGIKASFKFDAANPTGKIDSAEGFVTVVGRARALIFSVSTPEVKFRFPFIEGNGFFADPSTWEMEASSLLSASYIEIPSRDYLHSPAGFQRFVADDSPSFREPSVAEGAGAARSVSQQTLLTNIFPDADPAMVASNDDSLTLLFIADDPMRDDVNRNELAYMRYNAAAGTWSSPQPVSDDGTADLSPQVALLPGDRPVAVWHDGASVLPDPGPNPSQPTLDMLLATYRADSEISGAVYDAGTDTWASQRLTDDALFDHSPRIAASNGDAAMIAWITNDAGLEQGTDASPNRVRFALTNGTVFTPPQDAFEAPTLLEFDLTYNGTEATIIYSADMDGDYATADDRDLFVASYDGVTWGQPVRITDDAGWDTHPRFATNPLTGQPMVIWYHAGRIQTASDIAALSDRATAVDLGGERQEAADFRLATGPGGDLALLWQQVSGDLTDLAYTVFDPAAGTWSTPALLTNDESTERLGAPVVTASGDVAVALLDIETVNVDASQTDFDGDIIDLGEKPTFGQADLALIRRTLTDDLAVRADGLSLDIPNPRANDAVTITASVQNLGDRTARDVVVEFFDADPATGGRSIARKTIATLNAGASADATTDWTVPGDIPDPTVFVVVDPDDAQPDANRANNTASLLDLQLPDLIVARFEGRTAGPTDQILEVLIENRGGREAPAGIEIDITRDDTAEIIATLIVPDPIPASGGVGLTYRWENPPVFPAGALDLTAAADPALALTEESDDNNDRPARVYARVPAEARAAACPADINRSGEADIFDLFDFLSMLDENNLAGDLDGDGAMTIFDLFDFLAAMDTPCPEAPTW